MTVLSKDIYTTYPIVEAIGADHMESELYGVKYHCKSTLWFNTTAWNHFSGQPGIYNWR